MKKMLNLTSFLTKRDEWAGTFEDVVMQRSSPRTDCPQKLPDAPGADLKQLQKEKRAEQTDLQKSFLDLAAGLNGIRHANDLVKN